MNDCTARDQELPSRYFLASNAAPHVAPEPHAVQRSALQSFAPEGGLGDLD